MLPLVVIAGRPNVGKSTLFNRLAGRRMALVADTPGVTRDRKEAEALLRGRRVRLVDTAGLEEAAPETLAGRMRDGVGGGDGGGRSGGVRGRCARRASRRPTGTSPSGCGGRAGRCCWSRTRPRGASARSAVLDAFELGLGEPVAVSAEHGEGISELMTRDRRPAAGRRMPEADAEEARHGR